MRISNSKKELARIIRENGGWRDGAEFFVSTCNGIAIGSKSKPKYTSKYGWVAAGGFIDDRIELRSYLKNWHQTILSRDEYFHLYPAPDADGWIEWNGGECPVGDDSIVDVMFCNGRVGIGLSPLPAGGAGMEGWRLINGRFDIIAYRLHKPEQSLGELCGEAKEENKHGHIDAKPTIEQLATDYRNAKDYAERKQQEADAAKADVEAKLAELVAAGKALGLVLSVAGVEPELVIHDWRDLQVGDIIECIGSWEREDTDGHRFAVTAIDPRKAQVGKPIRIEVPEVSCPGTWGLDFKFIRRP